MRTSIPWAQFAVALLLAGCAQKQMQAQPTTAVSETQTTGDESATAASRAAPPQGTPVTATTVAEEPGAEVKQGATDKSKDQTAPSTSTPPPGRAEPKGAPRKGSSSPGASTPKPAAPMAHGATPEAPVPSTPVVPAGQARVGDRTSCVVTGTEFVVTTQSPKLEHEGKTYFFCCSDCVDKFKANPKKYLARP